MAIRKPRNRNESKDNIKHFERNGGLLLKRKLKKKNPELHKLKEKIEKLELKKNLEKLNEKNEELKRLKEIYPEPEIYSARTMNSMSTFWPEIEMIECNPRIKFYSGTSTTNDVEQPGTSRATSQNTQVEVVVQKIEEGVPEDRIEDFVDELIFLSEPHQNLVRVLGCCLEKREPLIVYERRGVENTTLSDCTSSNSVLAANFSCEMRIEAAKGLARGLEHFYKFKFNPTFVRGDISSANIMMDTTSYEPKIFYAAGSNLIAPAPDPDPDPAPAPAPATAGGHAQSMAIAGAPDPDPDPAPAANDVYRFGIILVELLTGGRTVGTDLPNSISKAQAIVMAQENRLVEILDDEMKGQGTVVSKAATLAHRCLNVTPAQRPTMKEVLDELLDRPTERDTFCIIS